MLRYVSENPWPLASILGLAAVGFLVALWVTQQGKYLIWGGAAAALALLLLVVEHLWVTDNERIEAVVYDLARAAQANDADRVVEHLAPEVVLEMRNISLPHQVAIPLLRAGVEETQFDFIRISRLTASAGRETRLGKAEFRAQAMGSIRRGGTQFNFLTRPIPAESDWSLGFRETSPGVWKVTRISPPATARQHINLFQ